MLPRILAVSLGLLALAGSSRARTSQAPAAAAPDGYVGANTCAACHQAIHTTWTRGRHSQMLQRATAAAVVGDFSGASVTLHGRPFHLRVAAGGYFVTESYLTGRPQEHRVEFTLGSRRVQHYLTTIDNGWMIVLPPSWDVERREWFDNMDIVRPAAGDRTPVQQWNRDCVGCHVSGEQKHFDVFTRTYATAWTDFGTSCERCHGPGRSHARKYSKAPAAAAQGDDPQIVRPTRLDPATSSMICAQCHSLRNVVNPNYVPGADYYDFFNPRLEYDPATDRELPYWPDGRPRRFSNDAIGLWQSACFRRGQATCTTCHHDPHEPNVERNAQLRADNNALCTPCHQAIGDRLAAHSHHAPTSTGSSCVECHMPKTVISLKATMRDHTISVPAPENTAAFHIPNACTECHADRKAQWAIDTLNAWWPNGRRATLIARARAFSGGRRGSADALDGLLAIAADASDGPLIQATALGYLRRYSGERVQAALVASAKAEHPAVRAAAIASLATLPPADGGPVRAVLVAALSDRRRAVRIAALVSLINARARPLEPADRERLRDVGREFEALSPLYNDDAGFDRDLGVVKLLTGDFNGAAEQLEIALHLDPQRASAGFLLALVRLVQGRVADARTLLERVPASDPAFEAARRRLRALEQR